MSNYDDENLVPDDKPLHAASDVDYGSTDYDDFLKDAERDDRIGDHDWMVSRVTHDYWPSGDPRIKIQGSLLTASGQTKPKADCTISPPPAPDVIKAESSQWDSGKKKAIAQTINLYRQLKTYYNTTPDQITEGDVFRVKVIVTKKQDDGSGGFARVAAFKGPAELSEVGKETKVIPF